jgi:uncharacterized protein YndB with AHSA1/START domain
MSGQKEVIITRVVDAPRALVFKAWTDSKQVAQWWGPNGFTTPVSELDPRPGGTIRIDMRGPDGVVYPSKGVFREIIEPERLVTTTTVFEDEQGNPKFEVLTTVTFAEHDGKTKLTVHAVVTRSTAAPEVSRAIEGMEEGWTQSLDRLAQHLAGAISETKFVAEPGKQEVIVTRIFDAPRDLVFKTYLDPDLISEWWGPRSLTTKVEKMEARPGGSWRLVQRDPQGNEYAFHGVYHDVTPSERVIQTFEFEGMPGHVSLETCIFEESQGRTIMTERSVFQSVEDRDGMLESGMREGMAESMDRLAELLQRLRRGAVRAA